MPKTGRPVMKARVPSIGSSTQRIAAMRADRGRILPQNAVFGKAGSLRTARIACSASRSASVTGEIALEGGDEPGAEKRPNDSAGGVGGRLRRLD